MDVPHQNTKWQPSASLRDGLVSTIAVLDTVDSTNSLLARALAVSPYSDARQRVEGLFGDRNSTTDVGTKKGTVPGTEGKAENTPRNNTRKGITTATSDEGRVASKGIRRWPGTGICRVPLSVAVSDIQTRCRGRLEHTWTNKAGRSLLSSWAVAMPGSLTSGPLSGWLPLVAGFDVIQGLREVLSYHQCTPLRSQENSAPSPCLKWPNDLFLDGHKLGGILCELVPVDMKWSVVIIGVGMNLWMPQERFPTVTSTSLHLHYAGLPEYQILRDDLVDAISWHLSQDLTGLVENRDQILTRLSAHIRELCWTLGREVEVKPVTGDPICGRALSINPDASLQVELVDGSVLAVSTGDVGVLPEVRSGFK